MGSLRVGHDWMTSLSPFTFMHWRRKWQPTPVFLPRESQRQWAPIYGVAESRTRLKRLSSSSSRDIKALRANCSSCRCYWNLAENLLRKTFFSQGKYNLTPSQVIWDIVGRWKSKEMEKKVSRTQSVRPRPGLSWSKLYGRGNLPWLPAVMNGTE